MAELSSGICIIKQLLDSVFAYSDNYQGQSLCYHLNLWLWQITQSLALIIIVIMLNLIQ